METLHLCEELKFLSVSSELCHLLKKISRSHVLHVSIPQSIGKTQQLKIEKSVLSLLKNRHMLPTCLVLIKGKKKLWTARERAAVLPATLGNCQKMDVAWEVQGHGGSVRGGLGDVHF